MGTLGTEVRHNLYQSEAMSGAPNGQLFTNAVIETSDEEYRRRDRLRIQKAKVSSNNTSLTKGLNTRPISSVVVKTRDFSLHEPRIRSCVVIPSNSTIADECLSFSDGSHRLMPRPSPALAASSPEDLPVPLTDRPEEVTPKARPHGEGV
jgi:hypothetical protein